MYNDISMNEACAIITRGIADSNTLILMHTNPDGDAVGSAFGLKILIEALGGRAVCLCADEVQNRLKFLFHGQETCEITEETDVAAILASADKIIAVDVASPAQLGKIREFFEGKIDLSIDHHAIGEAVGPRLIDKDAAAAGEIVFDVSKNLAIDVKTLKERGFYERVYAAISSDTGCFKYTNATPSVYRKAAEILEMGIDIYDVNGKLFDSMSEDEVRAVLMTYAHRRSHCDGKLSSILITRNLIEEYDLVDKSTGSIVDTVRSVEGVWIGVTVRQTKDDPTIFRVSSRANIDINVSDVCKQFGGGGHVRAAGCSITAETPEAAYETIIAAFADKVNEKAAELNEIEKSEVQ